MVSTNCIKDMADRHVPLTLLEASGEPVILVVDDDPGIRRFICTLLQHTVQASVLAAANPFDALSDGRSD